MGSFVESLRRRVSAEGRVGVDGITRRSQPSNGGTVSAVQPRVELQLISSPITLARSGATERSGFPGVCTVIDGPSIAGRIVISQAAMLRLGRSGVCIPVVISQ